MKNMLKTIKRRFSGAGKEEAPKEVAPAPAAAAKPVETSFKSASSSSSIPPPPPPLPASSIITSASLVVGSAPMTDDYLTPLPKLPEVPASERPALLLKKIRMCCVIFDFRKDPTSDAKAKELKRVMLLDLVDYVGTSKSAFTDAVLGDAIHMIAVNLFRALPPVPYRSGLDPEEDEPQVDEQWPHLQVVYEFLLRILISAEQETKVLKKYINQEFFVNLLELFDSEDARERDYLKTILHRLYGKFMSLRAFMRSAINNVFFRFVYETERHNGVGELLEILGSIINGFALPLKEEHKNFLILVLTPLHKVRMLSAFHQQLAYCVSQFIEKDPSLSVPVISQLIRYWPIQNSQKEILYLNELEELLELTPPEYFQKFMVPLFKVIARAVGCSHFQVAERALFLWNSEYVATLVSDFRDTILPIVFPALQKNAEHHWNATVHSLSQNVLKLFSDMDANLYQQCLQQYNAKLQTQKEEKRKRQEKWAQLEAQAKRMAPGRA